MVNKITIGLVLSSVPSYSETFFRTKINGLAESGFSVFLFASGKTRPDLNCKLITPYPVFKSHLLRVLSVFVILPLLFVRSPGNLLRFWKFERAGGLPAGEIVRRLYINGHILTRQLSWLHFGFTVVAIDREQVARSIGAKMAVSFRGYDINVYPLIHPGCFDEVWERTHKVHSISKYLLEKSFSLGLPKNKPSQIIAPAVASAQKLKDNFQFQSILKIVSIARLHWIKGLEYSIQAVAILKSQGIRLQYSIIGEGAEYEKLKYEIECLNLQNEVILIGRLPHQKAILQTADSDIYLQPSLNEGFCNAVLEAQSMGCLCVVSAAGALAENVINGVTGWLVPPRNAQALAETILKIIDLQPEARRRVSEQAIKRVEEKFTMKEHIAAWRMFYEEDDVNL